MSKEQDKQAVKKAKDTVFRILKIRSRSEKEIRDKLKQKGFTEPLIDQTIRYFTNLELINDRQFAKGWIASRLAKPYGSHRIRFELKNKGIDKEVLEEELIKATHQYPEEEIVLSLAQKRAKKYKDIDPIKVKQRLLNYLTHRGFNNEVIYKAINKL